LNAGPFISLEEDGLATKLVLKTALGAHAHVKPLRDGRVNSDRVTLEFHDFEPLPKAFRLMVRGDDLDLSEMAVVTHLLAVDCGREHIGLAIPLWSRLPHANLVCAANGPINCVKDLEGTRVGVRAYAQTSGVWVRGILEEDYGVDLNSILWGTMEDAHLPEYVDPSITRRYPPKPALRDLMLAGEFSAIMGERVVDPANIRPVIPDAEIRAREWIARTGIHPINHTLSIRRALTQAHPWLAAELMEMFDRARSLAIAEDGAEAPPAYGYEANTATIDKLLDYSHRQQITQRRYLPSELYLPI